MFECVKAVPEFGRKQLAHDEERDVGVTTRVGENKEKKRSKRQPTEG